MLEFSDLVFAFVDVILEVVDLRFGYQPNAVFDPRLGESYGFADVRHLIAGIIDPSAEEPYGSSAGFRAAFTHSTECVAAISGQLLLSSPVPLGIES